MKIISIRQPWASLIVQGIKDIENRTWRTHHRGPVLIHASQRLDDISESELRRRFGVKFPKYMPTGGVIGIVDVVDCVEDHDSKWFNREGFGFVLKNPRRLPFAKCPGQLGLRDAPRALLARIPQLSAKAGLGTGSPARSTPAMSARSAYHLADVSRRADLSSSERGRLT